MDEAMYPISEDDLIAYVVGTAPAEKAAAIAQRAKADGELAAQIELLKDGCWIFSGLTAAEESVATVTDFRLQEETPVADKAALETLSGASMGDEEQGLSRIREELQQLADACKQHQHSGAFLDNRALVDEVYRRVSGSRPLGRDDRLRFFELAGNELCRMIVERARQAFARPIVPPPVWADDTAVAGLSSTTTLALSERHPDRVLARQERWTQLAEADATVSQIFALFAFAGRGKEEIADLLGLPVAEVDEDLKSALVEVNLEES